MKGLTYKKKNRVLLGIALLTLMVVYQFGIKRTFRIYQEYSASVELSKNAAQAPKMAARLEKELTVINTKIGKQDSNEQDHSEALLGILTNYCQGNQSVLREFPKKAVAEQGDLLVETNRFVVEGSFAKLVGLVYLLEQKYKIGKVVSVRYQLRKDQKTKEMILVADVFLQNITKKTV